MIWHEATEDDIPAIEAFLQGRIESSMFPLANLKDHELNGDAPRSMRFLIDRDAGVIRNLFGLTREGMAMPQMPDADKDALDALTAILRGHALVGVLGEAAQVRTCLCAFGLSQVATNLNTDEPAFALDLAQMKMPDVAGFTLRIPDESDRDLLVEWRVAYHMEVLGTPDREASETASENIEDYLSRGSHRVLLYHGEPVSMTGFNARFPGIVQIGGVYTPLALRGRGFARRALALHLQEAFAEGVEKSVLFAASKAAIRAYQAVGFERWGEFALVLFSQPESVA